MVEVVVPGLLARWRYADGMGRHRGGAVGCPQSSPPAVPSPALRPRPRASRCRTVAPQRSGAGSGLTATSILSVRRIPGWVAETVAGQRLAPSLSAVLAQPALRPAAASSCLEVSQGGRTCSRRRSAGEPDSGVEHEVADGDRGARQARGDGPADNPGRCGPTGAGGRDRQPLPRRRRRPTAGHRPDATGLGPGQTLYTLPQPARQPGAGGRRDRRDRIGRRRRDRYDGLRTVPTWKPEYAAEGDVAPLSALEVNNGAAPAGPPTPPAGATSRP